MITLTLLRSKMALYEACKEEEEEVCEQAGVCRSKDLKSARMWVREGQNRRGGRL